MMRRPRTVSGAGFSAFRETQKPRLSRGFCNKKRGEEKNEKDEEESKFISSGRFGFALVPLILFLYCTPKLLRKKVSKY